MVDEGQQQWGGRNQGNALVANNNGSRRPLQSPLARVHGGRDSNKEGGTKETIGGGWNGRKNGAAMMTTTNMVPRKCHWRHRGSDNQLYDNNDSGKTGQWPIATTATATKWGHNDNNNKYDSRER